MATTLSFIFSTHIRNGELEFLRNRTIYIQVQDADIEFRLTLAENRLAPGARDITYDLCIRGSVYDFLTLISRREDTDTLFFQRRLKMEGDTELGLYVKNFLDGMDVESLRLHKPGTFAIQQGMWLYERLFG